MPVLSKINLDCVCVCVRARADEFEFYIFMNSKRSIQLFALISYPTRYSSIRLSDSFMRDR